MGEAELLQRFPRRSLRPLPSRKTMHKICPKYVRGLDALRAKVISPRQIEKKFFQKPKANLHITEKLALALNASTLLECSNMAPFKSKTRSGYPCFYCKEVLEDMDSLRTHQEIHPKSMLFKLLTKGPTDSMVVYADVADLKCSLCGQCLKSLPDLKCHLKMVHEKRMYEQCTDRVIPFELIGSCDFKCQVCGFNFETFGTIERHMNVHFRNFVCEKCGAGFVTRHRLKVHRNMQHKQGHHPCSKCKKSFPTLIKFKMHYDVIHNNKKPNKCIKCAERFVDYFTRQRHMVEKHGFKPILYRCGVCEKAFNRRFSLSIHLKRCHMNARDVKCDKCEYTCVTKSELRAHMSKHGAVKLHECGVCKKSYARKKTLKEHMRIHDDDRRYVCGVCGQAFVQNCSLKQHVKSHHGEKS